MANAYDSAQQENENQRRAAVAALAASGTAGAAALADANSNISTMRDAALRTELARTAGRQMGGIQEAGLAELRGMISRPYDMLNASVAAQQGSAAQRLAATTGETENYFRQIGAAIPIQQQNMVAKLAIMKAEEEREARERAESEDALSDSELRNRLLGAGDDIRGEYLGAGRDARDTARTERDSLRQALQVARYGTAEGPAGPMGPQGPNGTYRTKEQRKAIELIKTALEQSKGRIGEAKGAIGDVKARPDEAYAREAGLAAGLDPARVKGLLRLPERDEQDAKPASRIMAMQDAARQAGIGGRALAKIITPSGDDEELTWYEVAAGQAQEAIKDGIPFETFRKDLETHLPKKLKRTKALVLAQFGPAFQA